MAPQAPPAAAPPSATATGFASGPGLPPIAQSTPGATSVPKVPAPGVAVTPGPGVQQAAAPAAQQAPAGIAPGSMGAPGGDAAGHAGAGGMPPGIPLGKDGKPDMTKINPYIYSPSFSFAVIGATAFLISFIVHMVQLVRTRAWYFFVLTQGVLIAAIGMIARTNSVVTLKETGATGPFIISQIMDSTAGTIVSLANIFTYTRIMFWVTPNEKRNFATLWSPPLWTSLMWGMLLMTADITKMVSQNVYKKHEPIGAKIEITAQIIQFFLLSTFAFVTYRFMLMSRKWLIHGAAEEKNWRKLGWTVCICSWLMAFRHVFTIVQMDARADPRGYFSLHEWVYWVTGPLVLFVIFTLYNFAFPGYYFPREYVGFKIDLKKIQKEKLENPWPLTISPPIHNDDLFVRDDKGVEVRLTELETGKRY